MEGFQQIFPSHLQRSTAGGSMILPVFLYSQIIRINTNTLYHSSFKNWKLEILHFHFSETLLGTILNYKQTLL